MRNEDKPQKSRETVKKLWIAIGVLVLLSPLGIIIPSLFGAGSAWGEWSTEEIRRLLGFVPEGMQKLGHLWKSPLSNYMVPGQKQGLVHEGLRYALSAVFGVGITAGLGYALAKLLGKKNR